MKKLLFLLLVSFGVFAYQIPSHYKKVDYELKAGMKRKPKVKASKLKDSSSGNWSGYVVPCVAATAPNSTGGTQVLGSWVVPAVKATEGFSHTYSSFWVGIDGWASGQVEQLGTEQDVVNGVQQNYAWFEMYPGPSYVIDNFPVDVGDLITAEVNYGGNNQFYLTIVNDTKQVFFLVPLSYTKVSTFAPRSSLEWIVEAPYLNGILPLANFGTANFINCTGQISWGSTLQIGSYSNFDFINMVNSSGKLKDQTSPLTNNGSNFAVTWQSSN